MACIALTALDQVSIPVTCGDLLVSDESTPIGHRRNSIAHNRRRTWRRQKLQLGRQVYIWHFLLSSSILTLPCQRVPSRLLHTLAFIREDCLTLLGENLFFTFHLNIS
jgi:hypothetical protein